MAFRSVVVSIGTATASLVFEAQAGDLNCEIRTPGALDFYVGGADLTASNGMRVDNGIFSTPVRPGDQIWAMSAESSGHSVRLLVRSA